MASPSSFVADPGRRIAAFVFDLFAIFLGFLVVSAVAEVSGIDVRDLRTLVICALVYHYGFVAFREGRTLGKQAQDICVIDAAGKPARNLQAFIRSAVRFAPLFLLTVDADEWLIADELISAAFRFVALVVFLIDLALLQRSPTRQTLADKAARTLVVRQPTREPHRAPAIPMYSATDAEFGSPPKHHPGERP